MNTENEEASFWIAISRIKLLVELIAGFAIIAPLLFSLYQAVYNGASAPIDAWIVVLFVIMACVSGYLVGSGFSLPRLSGFPISNIWLEKNIKSPSLRSKIRHMMEEAKNNPTDATICNRLGEVFRDEVKNPNIAIKWFKTAMRRFPNSSYPYDRIGEVIRDYYQDYNSAFKWFKASSEVEKGNAYPTDRIGELFKNNIGDLDKALEWFSESLKREPSDWYAYQMIGDIYNSGTGEFDKAIEWYKRAAEVTPGNSDSCNRLGEIYKNRKGDYEESKKWYLEAFTRNSKNAWTCDRLGEIFESQYQFEKALVWFEKSISLKPDNQYAIDSIERVKQKKYINAII